MWAFLGLGAIAFAVMNLEWSLKGRETKWFRFASLSLTALTVCAFYTDGALRLENRDLAGLMDVMPAMSKALWVCVVLSILINSVSLFRDK